MHEQFSCTVEFASPSPQMLLVFPPTLEILPESVDPESETKYNRYQKPCSITIQSHETQQGTSTLPNSLELLLLTPCTGKAESPPTPYHYGPTGDLLLTRSTSKLSRLSPVLISEQKTWGSSLLEPGSPESVSSSGNARTTYLQLCQFINVNLFGLVFTILIKPIFSIFQLQCETIPILKQSIQNR